MRQQHNQQIRGLQQIIQSQISRLDKKEQALRHQEETMAAEQQLLQRKINENYQLMRERDQVIEEKERTERQLEESGRVIAQFQGRIAELEQLKLAADTTPRSKEQSRNRAGIELTWREGKKAPCKMYCSLCSAEDSNMLYIKIGIKVVYAFTISTSMWSQLPDCPVIYNCPLVIVNNLLTLVGGDTSDDRINTSNRLFSLTGEDSTRRWTEEFPRMPTKRCGSTVLCTGTALIVVGGEANDGSPLKTVEIMNTVTKQWSTAAILLQPVMYAPAAVCGDRVYILGGDWHVHMFSSYPHPVTQVISSQFTMEERYVYWSVERSCCTTSHRDHLCVHSRSTPNNWWEGFRSETHLSHSHVQPNH